MNVPSALSVSAPFAAAVPPFSRLHVSCAAVLSGSLSLPATVVFRVPFSSIGNRSSSATGGSFTGSTVIVAVAWSQAADGSHTAYTKLTTPLKSGSGV